MDDHDHHKHHKDHQHSHNHHDHSEHHAHMIEDFKQRFWISLALSIPVFVLAPMIQSLLGFELSFSGDVYLRFALSVIVFVYGGWPFLKGLKDELSERSPGMMTLIGLAIGVAFIYSTAVAFGLAGKTFFWELVSLIVIMLLGHWIEMKSVMGASSALNELKKLIPNEATVIENGLEKQVSVGELSSGMIVLVKPGEKIPADGKISKGSSSINESMVTGESKPVERSEGDEVIGGSINGSGSLEVEISKSSDEGYLSQVIDMVSRAQQSRSKTQNFADKAAGWLFYLALGAGILTFIAWWIVGKELSFLLERTVTVLVISCPHALGLAIPLVVSISTAISAKNGLLIRNRTAFEQAGKTNCVIFDKTGTLTKGEFGVNNIKSFSELGENDILKLSASLEQNSEHPIGGGILKKAKDESVELNEIEDFQSITGAGIKAKMEGVEYHLVGPGFLRSNEIEFPENEGNGTIVYLLKEKELIGSLELQDEIRESSFEAVKSLKDSGIEVIMATGDNEQVAKEVADTLGIEKFSSGVKPEDKQNIVEKLQKEGKFVAMTGDGINDAPALAQADIGIAVGSGTDVASETADIILVNSDPMDIVRLLDLGKATHRKMVQNLYWAAGYNILAVPLAAGVLSFAGIMLSPAVGAVLMSLSTVIVAINAQLLKRKMAQV